MKVHLVMDSDFSTDHKLASYQLNTFAVIYKKKKSQKRGLCIFDAAEKVHKMPHFLLCQFQFQALDSRRQASFIHLDILCSCSLRTFQWRLYVKKGKWCIVSSFLEQSLSDCFSYMHKLKNGKMGYVQSHKVASRQKIKYSTQNFRPYGCNLSKL